MAAMTQLVIVAPSIEFLTVDDAGRVVAVKVLGQWLCLPEPCELYASEFDGEPAQVLDFSDYSEIYDIGEWANG